MTLDHPIEKEVLLTTPKKWRISSALTAILEPASIRERINNMPMNASLVYGIMRAYIEKFVKTKKNIHEFSKPRLLRLKCQAFIYFLQNYKHIEPIPWRTTQLVGDLITYLPFPYSYVQGEDLISYRPINPKDISEILMLLSSLWSNATNCFLIMGDRKVASMLIVSNKTTFWLAQLLRARKLKHSTSRELLKTEDTLAMSPTITDDYSEIVPTTHGVIAYLAASPFPTSKTYLASPFVGP